MTDPETAPGHEVKNPDAILVAPLSAPEFEQQVHELRNEYEDALVVKLRGTKMRTMAHMFDEVGAALQLPWYFGENWSALYDCLNDIEPADVLLMVSDAHLVLDQEDPRSLGSFVDVIVEMHDQSAPGAGSFRAILQAPPDAASTLWDRLTAAGHAVVAR